MVVREAWGLPGGEHPGRGACNLDEAGHDEHVGTTPTRYQEDHLNQTPDPKTPDTERLVDLAGELVAEFASVATDFFIKAETAVDEMVREAKPQAEKVFAQAKAAAKGSPEARESARQFEDFVSAHLSDLFTGATKKVAPDKVTIKTVYQAVGGRSGRLKHKEAMALIELATSSLDRHREEVKIVGQRIGLDSPRVVVIFEVPRRSKDLVSFYEQHHEHVSADVHGDYAVTYEIQS